MPLLGAHMSISGGYHKAVEAAAELGMDCVQLFTKNNNQWRAKPLTDEDVSSFRKAIETTGIRMPCAHDSYLINLASPSDELWQKSLEAFVVELERAEALGLRGVVMHPGSYVESSEQHGLERVVRAIDAAHRKLPLGRTQIWLENTAGQGSNLGYRFQHLADIISNVQQHERVGVCLDSCHLFAAGYALNSRQEYEATMTEFDRIVGLDYLRAFHLNDSKKEFGSRVDRHEKIGAGFLGLNPFRHILNDPRFAELPMYLETPKGEEDGKLLDAVNLATLRGLLKRKRKNRHSAQSS